MTDCDWPFKASNYFPELENGHAWRKPFEEFASSSLSDQTSVVRLRQTTRGESNELEEEVLDQGQLLDYVKSTRSQDLRSVLFIQKFLVIDMKTQLPKDPNKLRISQDCFLQVIDHLQLPLSFVSALIQRYLPTGQGFSSSTTGLASMSLQQEIWYILPVRTQYRCSEKQKSHANSTSGSNQMNPVHYLHLPDAEVDIRGSHIAIFSHYGANGSSSESLVFNFMDGRWSKSVEEPKRRILEASSQGKLLSSSRHPFNLHIVYFTTVIRWWTNALSSVNDQLIAYEKQLQDELDNEGQASHLYNIINRSLHAVAAHLHRYNSELTSTQDSLTEVKRKHGLYNASCTEVLKNHPIHTAECFVHVESHLKQVRAFLQELELKLQNILALLFNRIQITNDRMMVSNGEKMHSIMIATQEDAKMSQELALQSQKLAEEMKRDSVAMKTIAVTTMFFLPGTSFAAFLAMPFFNQNQYLSDASKVWIWIVCTVPSTLIAFSYYAYWSRRDAKRSYFNDQAFNLETR